MPMGHPRSSDRPESDDRRPSTSLILRALLATSRLADLFDELEPTGDDVVRLMHYESAEALARIAPDDSAVDLALQRLTARVSAMALLRDGVAIEVVPMAADDYLAWLGDRPNTPEARRQFIQAHDRPLTGAAALRLLGLPLDAAAPRRLRPATGGSLAARMARWALDPQALPAGIEALAEELLRKGQDGALGILAGMLEPEDFVFVAAEIDTIATRTQLPTAGGVRDASLFVSAAVRDAAQKKTALPPVPADLAGQLEAVGFAHHFRHIRLAPVWIATESIVRLAPAQLRALARALARGEAPPLPPAPPGTVEVALLGLAAADTEVARDDEGGETESSILENLEKTAGAWQETVLAVLGEPGAAEMPMFLCRARDILRRAELAVPSDDNSGIPWGDVDDGPPAVDRNAIAALMACIGGVGDGFAVVRFGDDDPILAGIADGRIGDANAFEEALEDALSMEGTLLVFARESGPPGGLRVSGYRLEENFVLALPAAEAQRLAEALAADAIGGAPLVAAAAPPLDYEPEV
ncbi:MAG TPA: hypothetical protein VGN83_02105 [Falsiroseomonas sp.]|jgi:hypothetical protein|nr:hypothetical protein [Falsiroseomonas sp.]